MRKETHIECGIGKSECHLGHRIELQTMRVWKNLKLATYFSDDGPVLEYRVHVSFHCPCHHDVIFLHFLLKFVHCRTRGFRLHKGVSVHLTEREHNWHTVCEGRNFNFIVAGCWSNVVSSLKIIRNDSIWRSKTHAISYLSSSKMRRSLLGLWPPLDSPVFQRRHRPTCVQPWLWPWSSMYLGSHWLLDL